MTQAGGGFCIMQMVTVTEHHKSRDRIKNLGEVFTPEKYVEEMLDLIGKSKSKVWSDLNTFFFEPCCGHGNIVVPIIRRRLNAIYSTNKSNNKKEETLYAIANTINTLWAIDIDKENIETCRQRILCEVLSFALEKLNELKVHVFVSKNFDFMAHVICAINWQIYENETLSALAERKDAEKSASLTRLGDAWYTKNGHKPIDFSNTWVSFYNETKEDQTTPMLFGQAQRALNDAITGKSTLSKEFKFISFMFALSKQPSTKISHDIAS